MDLNTKQEILEVLTMPEETFWSQVAPAAREVCQKQFGTSLLVTAMLAYTNICKNQCLYCGMRAGNKIPRYRMSPEEILPLAQRAREDGLGRMFLLAGEDQNYGFEKLLTLIAGLRQQGYTIALGAGELSRTQYQELHDAGVEEYVLKFEMSHPDSFQRLNPSTTYAKRMGCAQWIKEAGMKLASGNIVDWPGQTLDELADDILLIKALEISWAPNIPYLPAANTPLAKEGGPGRFLLNNKEMAILRLMMPTIKITAQQPGINPKTGLADETGNLNAIACGANLLFCDLLPDAQADAFRPIDQRHVSGLQHCEAVAQLSGLTLDLGGE